MSKLLLREDDETYVLFMCPGCECAHEIPTTGGKKWNWNGRIDFPTFTPSIVFTQLRGSDAEIRCHSYVKDGKIQFLNDCTHKLAGQTVDLPEIQ